VRTLRERGFFCCPSTFPAVPMNKPSIRFTVSRHNGFEDIEALLEELAWVSEHVGGVAPEPQSAQRSELSLSATSR
jgi:hypothetical protein